MVFFIFNFFFNTRQIQQKLRLHNFQLQYLVARAFHTKISYQRNRLFFFLTNTRVTTHTHTHTRGVFKFNFMGDGGDFPDGSFEICYKYWHYCLLFVRYYTGRRIQCNLKLFILFGCTEKWVHIIIYLENYIQRIAMDIDVIKRETRRN